MVSQTELEEQVVKAVQGQAGEVNQIAGYISDKIPLVVEFCIKLLIVLVLFFIGKKIINFAVRLTKKSLFRSQLEEGSVHFMESLVKALLYIIMVAGMATYLGVEKTSIAALIGSLGVGIVLALKESLSNLAGGFILLIMKPFVVGDYIKEDSHGNEGVAQKIDLFYTYLLTPDNRTVSVPNGILSNTSLTNISKQDKRQLREVIGISYDADIRKAKKVIEAVLRKDGDVLKTEQIDIFVENLGESSIEIGWRVWVKPENYFTVKWRITEEIKYALDKAGISIPYRQMDITVKQVKEDKDGTA